MACKIRKHIYLSSVYIKSELESWSIEMKLSPRYTIFIDLYVIWALNSYDIKIYKNTLDQQTLAKICKIMFFKKKCKISEEKTQNLCLINNLKIGWRNISSQFELHLSLNWPATYSIGGQWMIFIYLMKSTWKANLYQFEEEII